MAGYATSPEAYQEYMSARERTAYWVQAHSSDPNGFYSPSIPPGEIDGFIPSPPSEAGSSHSLPPKMVLRYNDGRPDIPIPHANPRLSRRREPDMHGSSYGPPHPPGHHRSHTSSFAHNTHHDGSSPIDIRPSHHSSQHGRSGSHAVAPSRSRHPEPLGPTASSPEEIRILPSHAPSNAYSPRSAASPQYQRSHHSRSRSLPRTAVDPHLLPEGAIDPIPIGSPQSRPAAYPPPSSYRSHGAPQVNFAPQAGPVPWHGTHSSSGSANHSGQKVSPAIVYAPSHHGRAPHYAPPAVLFHPPQRGPNGMIYSHSAPVPLQGGPYPAPTAPNDYGERGRRDRMRSLGPGVVHQVPRSDGGEESDAGSGRSGSTYYVLPNAGQKVHAIAPSPEQSVLTATSTTKSPGPSPRKPFFQRLFSFAKIGSSTGGSGPRRKLERRHSTGDSGRQTAVPVNETPEEEMPV
ncbi:hypothetical protein P691DRAFT_675353 [Macrolepiota fuliginosa MF-IS2]|uniref:Uncharacterized protein n=1 Tax=Macrolepiota fuliginosa MF-IS2 TaxID=1400762 RepID=A0A9P5X6S9_9AGAR|nr:hypothetical protein P691DRAFT_675353 [Macrolepiota fuliginosa MF-IS2]